MYKIIVGFILSLALSISTNQLFAKSQTIKIDTITIQGNCGQCKERIEEAAFIKGVKQATWDKKTKVLVVTYNPKKTTLDKVADAIAKAGHDSAKHTAPIEVYNKIPSCCAYRSGGCDHE